MSQLAYNLDFDPAFPGMLVTAEAEYSESGIASELLHFGYAAFRSNDTAKPGSVRAPKRNKSTLVFSGDLITSNVVNGTVNGVALAPITFATNNLTTMTAIGAAIVALLAALPTPIVATAALSNSNNTLTITATDGHVLSASFVVTAGSSQATVTITNGTADGVQTFQGVALFTQQAPNISSGLKGYNQYDPVAMVRKGRIWVPITHAVVENDLAYVDFSAGNEGKFTNQTTAPNVGGIGRFRNIAAASGLSIAQLEIALPII